MKILMSSLGLLASLFLALYCHIGRRLATATQMMQKAKFSDLFNLQNGLHSWLASGLPVTTS